MPMYLYQSKKTGEIIEEYRAMSNNSPRRGFVRVYTVPMADCSSERYTEQDRFYDMYKSFDERRGADGWKRMGLKPDEVKKSIKKNYSTEQSKKRNLG